MTIYKIQINEKEKFIQKLSFKQLQDEIFNFMYKKTILEQSRKSLSFFILLYFLLLKDNKGDILLKSIFENNLDKVDKLNNDFSSIKGNLKAGQYSELKEKNGLTNIFENDIFFHLVKSVFNIGNFYIEYFDFFNKNPELRKELEEIDNKYGDRIQKLYYNFYSYKIEDTRIDDNGEEHDLSKSVYHMINMRMSRKIDLTLSLKTDIKKIESNSPIDVTFLQYIDTNIIYDIWDKYNLSSYVYKIWGTVNEYPIVSGSLGGILANIASKKIEYRKLDGRKNKKEKKELKKEIDLLKKEIEKNNNSIDLLVSINKHILTSSSKLEENLKKLDERIEFLENKSKGTSKLELEELKKERKHLGNLTVNVNTFNINGNVENLQNATENSTQN